MPGFIPWSNIDLTLRAQRSIWLSTTRPDGRPHTVPVWFCWDSTHVYFVTGRTTQKATNLAQQPFVVMHAGDGDDVLILEGMVEVIGDPDERARVDALYGEKYVDPKSGAKATILQTGDDLYRLQPVRVMAWEYGIVRTRTDWRWDAMHAAFARSS